MVKNYDMTDKWTEEQTGWKTDRGTNKQTGRPKNNSIHALSP